MPRPAFSGEGHPTVGERNEELITLGIDPVVLVKGASVLHPFTSLASDVNTVDFSAYLPVMAAAIAGQNNLPDLRTVEQMPFIAKIVRLGEAASPQAPVIRSTRGGTT